MFTALVKPNIFSTLDLKCGYLQIPLNEEDKEKTAFTCHRGLYKYNVTPFSLANAPGIFQELMSIVLHGLGDFATAYLDDKILLHKKKNINNIFKTFLIAYGNTTYNCQNVNTVYGLHN